MERLEAAATRECNDKMTGCHGAKIAICRGGYFVTGSRDQSCDM